MECKKCNKQKIIVNKYFSLCQECNNERLHGNKYGKRYEYIKPERKLLKSKKKYQKQQHTTPIIKSKKQSMLKLDEIFYEKCFNMSNHKCEECNTNLPTEFRDSEGKIIARFRYSHIVPKSISKKLRHNTDNINHLCLKCHNMWDFGDKKSMKIYEKNSKILPQFF